MKDGYYWVKINHNSNWIIQRIKNDIISFNNSEIAYPIKLIYQIGDYIETPDKYKDGK